LAQAFGLSSPPGHNSSSCCGCNRFSVEMAVVPCDNVYVTDLPGSFDDEQCKTIFGAYGVVSQCKVLPPKTEGQDKRAALVRFSDVEQAAWIVENLNGNIPEGLTEPIQCKFATPKSQMGGPGDNYRKMDNKGDGPIRPAPYAGGATMGNFSNERTACPIQLIISGLHQSGALPALTGVNNDAYAIHIGGLPADTTDADLYEIFSNFGAIGSKGASVVSNPDGTCKGHGFVNYLDQAAADTAVATLDGAVMPDGFALKLARKTPQSVAQLFGQASSLGAGGPSMPKKKNNTVATTSTGKILSGSVKSYNTAKGFGFITAPGLPTDVFFMRTCLPPEAQENRNLAGQMVNFHLTTTADGQMRAGEVTLS